MPVTKSARLRHKILDRCLQRQFNPLRLEQLAEEVNNTLAYIYGDGKRKVSMSTIYADLSDMEKEGSGWLAFTGLFVKSRSSRYFTTAMNRKKK